MLEANLPPCGGDVRQDRGGRAGTPGFRFALLAFFALIAAAPATAATFEAKRGLNMDIWVTWPDESGWGDAGVLFPYPEWRRFTHEADLRALKEAGFDFVRIPFDPAPFISGTSARHLDRLYEEVSATVDMALDADLKAIVDIHTIPRGDSPLGVEGVLADEESFKAYLEIVRRMGRTISDRDPEMVAFELMNEPSTACDAAGKAEWQERLVRLFAAARASAIGTTLILPGGCGGSAEGLAAVDPRQVLDDNVIWTFHSYQPFLLTHQGAEWAGDFIRYVTGLTYPPYAGGREVLETTLDEIRQRIRDEAPWARRAGMLSYLDEQIAEIDTPDKLATAVEAPFAEIAAWAKRYAIASEDILLGEFGMIRQEYQNPSIVPAAARAAYVKDMIEHAEAHGYGWAIWGYGGAFGVVDTFSGKKAEPDVLDVVRALPR
ncbi:MAG: glycoside hydrolase family 5 protein [Rhizobiaceae bacterium]